MLLAALAACSFSSAPRVNEPPPDLPPTAKVEVWRSLADDAATPRHAGDGGGTASLVDGPRALPVGTPASWTLRYEAGPHGVQVGGAVFFLPSPFWGWSPPQAVEPDAPGFTTAEAPAGVQLTAESLDAGLLRFSVGGRALLPGEVIVVRYGAGPAGALPDRYADAADPLAFAVDADGDGVRAPVPNPPTVRTTAGPAAALIVTVPTTARPGESMRLTVAAVDARGNMGATVSGAVQLHAPAAWALPATLDLGPNGRASLVVPAPPSGVYHLGASLGPLAGRSDVLLVHPDAPPLLWADLQVHTGLSDGTGSLTDAYTYARDVAGLDAVALTDHDHWGTPFLDATPPLWAEVTAAADARYEPGAFVTFAAYEWTSWLYGHRHVLYVGPAGPVFGSLDPATRTPDGLWAALRPHDALTIAHHSAGGPVAVDWRWRPDPRVEPVTEVVSVHGSSEAADSPGRIYAPVAGNTVRDALAAGHRFGFIGSTDGHDGHPGLAHLQAGSGGLAALFTADRTREGVATALRARQAYATNGARLLLRTSVDGVAMGGEVPITGAPSTAEVRIVASAPIERVELIRGASVIAEITATTSALRHTFPLDPLRDGEWVYVRVRLADGGVAWSSPIWGRAAP